MVDKDERKTEIAAFLAVKIKQAMEASPKTGDAIAEEIGVSKAAVSKWAKSGGIEPHNLYALAQATGRPVGWFFPGYRESGGPEAPGSLEDLLRGKEDDTEFLESALLTVLLAKQRASRRS